MPARINPYTGEVVLTELPSGLAFAGRTNSDMTPSKTAVVCAQLAGYGDDYFNNHFYMQVIHASHELLTIDGAPAPADFAAGATLTGAASLKTCVVVAKLTSLTYIVKSRSGAFTDGEVISDGTNSIDCGAGFPTFAAAAAPEHEVRKITDYVSLTGAFTVDTFTQVVDVLDEILVIHESLVSLGRDDADNVFDSSTVVKNRDGSVLERTEYIIDALMGTQFRTEQSKSGTVEENAFEMFNISLFDLDSGAIASADIDITAIAATMEKSAGGADFSSAGITQPTFVKADGRVYCSYQFLAAQWAVGNLYRLTVTGITAAVDGETVYCPTMVWSNAVLEAASIDAIVKDIDTDLGEPDDVVTSTLHGKIGTDTEMANRSLYDLMAGGGPTAFPAAANPANDVPVFAVIRAILKSMVGGDAHDGYTNISNTANASLNAIAQKFAATLGIDAANTFSSTIQGSGRTTIEAALDALATYFAASGAAFSVQVNGGTARTNLEQALEDFLAVVGADGANVFDPAMFAGSQTTIEAAFAALGTVIADIHATDLPAVKTVVDAIQTDIGDPSVRTNLKTLEAMLGNPDVAGASVYGMHAGAIDAVNRVAGKLQVKATTIDLAQIAASYDLFTGTTQDVIIEKLSFRLPNVNVADDATITSISIQSNDATPQVLVSSALGVKANLTAEAQISWTGAALLKAGKKIQLTIAGGAADAATVCDVVAEFRAVTGGGYLA